MDVSYIKFNSLSTATAILKLQSPSPKLSRDSSSRRPAPLCHFVAVRCWMSRSTPVGRIKWENLAKMLCQLWKASHIDMYDSRGRFSVQLKTDFSAWETVFLWKTTERDSRVGSVCSPLCSLFDDLQLTILSSRHQILHHYWSWDVLPHWILWTLLFNRTLQLCSLRKHTLVCVCVCVHTHAHAHTHPLFPGTDGKQSEFIWMRSQILPCVLACSFCS